MNRIKFSLTLFFIICLNISYSNAQTHSNDINFDLELNEEHYYFDTEINGAPAKIMMESGIQALIIGTDFYEQHKDRLKLKVKPSTSKMRFLNNTYNIKYTAQAKLYIDAALYDGPVFVLDDLKKLCIPIQYLKNPKDGSSIISIDLPSKRMIVKTKSDFSADERDYQTFPLRIKDEGGIPIVNSILTMNISDIKATMQGDFIVDLGNGSLLFLMKQNKEVAKMIADNHIELQEARDIQGRVVAEGLYADKLIVCGASFNDVSIGVTDKLQTIQEAGFLGLKFFIRQTVFDFKNKKLYIRNK